MTKKRSKKDQKTRQKIQRRYCKKWQTKNNKRDKRKSVKLWLIAKSPKKVTKIRVTEKNQKRTQNIQRQETMKKGREHGS